MSCDELSGPDRQLEALRAALGVWFTAVPGAVEESERMRIRHFNVLDEREKTVVRLTLASPRAVGGPSVREFEARHARLKLTGMRGYDSEYNRVAQLLPAAGFNIEGISAKVDVPMRLEERADVVVARVLRRLREVQEVNLPGALANIDAEFLHDLRVSVRRTRSILREMKGVFIPDELAHFRAEFKWLQSVTSTSRDLDVYVEEFDGLRELVPERMRRDLDPLLELLVQRRHEARAAMQAELLGERAQMLHAEWEELLQVLVLEDESVRPDARRPIAELTAERVRKVHRRMVKVGRTISLDSPPQHYHDLRKRGKELRYLLELFATALFDPEVVRPMVRALKGLQDVLGRHQDREVQIATLRALAEELVKGPGAATTVMAIGVMVDRLEVDAHAARESFAQCFADFASDEQRALVGSTFFR
jgi:CHAD domain-containing protein